MRKISQNLYIDNIENALVQPVSVKDIKGRIIREGLTLEQAKKCIQRDFIIL